MVSSEPPYQHHPHSISSPPPRGQLPLLPIPNAHQQSLHLAQIVVPPADLTTGRVSSPPLSQEQKPFACVATNTRCCDASTSCCRALRTRSGPPKRGVRRRVGDSLGSNRLTASRVSVPASTQACVARTTTVQLLPSTRTSLEVRIGPHDDSVLRGEGNFKPSRHSCLPWNLCLRGGKRRLKPYVRAYPRRTRYATKTAERRLAQASLGPSPDIRAPCSRVYVRDSFWTSCLSRSHTNAYAMFAPLPAAMLDSLVRAVVFLTSILPDIYAL